MTNQIAYRKPNVQNKKSLLCIENTTASDLAEKYGTPLYVYSKNQITNKFTLLRKALDKIPTTRILYALKANSNVEVLKHISSLGAGADTVSAGEIFLALKAGFSPDSISLAGVGKTEKDIDFALTRNIGVIIAESKEEIEIISKRAAVLKKNARVMLRINPDVDARTHPHISTGLKENKFGINIDCAEAVVRFAAKQKNIVFVGIHSHIGSQITEVEPFAEAAESIHNFVLKLKRDGIRIKQIDLGGGIGVRYRNAVKNKFLPVEKREEPTIDLAALAELIEEKFLSLGCEVAIEPGRFIVAAAGVLLTRVLYKKKSHEKIFVIVDAGMNDMMRHALYSAYHQIVPAELAAGEFEIVDVVGPVCESTDAFALGRELPAVKQGDLVAILTVGAYGYSLASNYNSRPKPAEILVEKDSARVIRDRQTLEDLV
ncbi:MAG: diaminopimelate decarboxylase [Candidatus Kryptoniota bacterium]